MTTQPSAEVALPLSEPLPPGAAEELAVALRSLAAKLLVLGLLAAWVLLFHFWGNSTFGYVDTPSLFGWLNYSYANSEDDEMGRYMPFLVLGLCWWKRDDLVKVTKSPWAGGLAIVLVALVLHLLGFMIQQTRLSTVAFYLGVYGLLGVCWGREFLRAIFFPFFLVVFCVPVGTMADTLTLPLRILSTSITAWISRHGLGVALIQSGTMIFDANGTFRYEVATACGGLRSLTATIALASIYAFISLDRPWRRLLMVVSAFPLAVAGNVLRLTLIVLAAEAFGQKTGDWVHSNAVFSMMPYVPAFLGLGALGSLLRSRSPEENTASTAAGVAGGAVSAPAERAAVSPPEAPGRDENGDSEDSDAPRSGSQGRRYY